MMIDPQGDAAQIFFKTCRQHLWRCHIYGNDGVTVFRLRLGQIFMKPAKPLGDLRIFDHMGTLSQVAQNTAQGSGGA